MSRNIDTFNRGIAVFNRKYSQDLEMTMEQLAIDVLDDAIASLEANNLTGNVLNSYAVGIYLNGELRHIYFGKDVQNLRKPTRRKLSWGTGKQTFKHYDSGETVTVNTNNINTWAWTDQKYSYQTAESMLKSYKVSTKRGWTFVFCTGSEYAVFLEELRNVNVYSETRDRIPLMLENALKKL